MSDSKKYYYLRLKENFFDEERIQILESLENGVYYLIILLKIYLKSIKHEGALQINERIPYKLDVLARVLGYNADIVKQALLEFHRLDLIEILDNGKIFVTDIQNFIGHSSTEAERKKEYRRRIEREKQVFVTFAPDEFKDICPDIPPPEIEIEIEIE